MGLKRQDSTPKLLFHLWAMGGLEAVQDIAQIERGLQEREQGHCRYRQLAKEFYEIRTC